MENRFKKNREEIEEMIDTIVPAVMDALAIGTMALMGYFVTAAGFCL